MLAVVIPYYNFIYFEQTLNSLAFQTNKNFKVYIGDDASPDDPKQLLCEFKGILDIYYWRFQENLGRKSLTHHWKRCIDLTGKEEWIMLLGDDDILDPSVIEEWFLHLKAFESKSNVIRFASQIINEKSEIKSSVYTHPKWESAFKSFYRKYKNLSRSSLSEHIFRKSIYYQKGFSNFELAWHSDDMAWIEFSGKKPIYTINDSVVSIRISESSISGKNDNLRLKRQASVQFYKLLIKNKLRFFERFQRTEILRRYEDLLIYSGELKFEDWLFLSKYYMVFFEKYHFKKFLKRFLKSYLERK